MNPGTSALLRRLVLLAAAVGLGAFAAAAPSPAAATAAGLPFSQALIDKAVAEPLLAFGDNLQNKPMAQAKAVNFMALAVHLAPAAAASDGTLVRDRLLAQLRSLITGGQEPNANGSLSGWTHNHVAQAFLLAKRTPAIWSRLTPPETEKIDWLMRAMAVAGHFCFDDGNHFKTDLGNRGNFSKLWNPNYREGYVGVVIAADLYFGTDALNDLFVHFNYDDYLARFREFGFTNALAAWTSYAWKPVLENGGADAHGGSGRGIRHPFTYGGVGLDNPFGIFKKLADYMYAFDVIDGVTIDGVVCSHTLGGASSPWLGQPGMCREFKSGDAQGPRSSLAYASEGWHNSVGTRASLEALGRWTGPADDLASVEAKMQVGSDDLIFKAVHGFAGYSHGGHMAVRNEAVLARTGYDYDKALWLDLLKPGFRSRLRAATGQPRR